MTQGARSDISFFPFLLLSSFPLCNQPTEPSNVPVKTIKCQLENNTDH